MYMFPQEENVTTYLTYDRRHQVPASDLQELGTGFEDSDPVENLRDYARKRGFPRARISSEDHVKRVLRGRKPEFLAAPLQSEVFEEGAHLRVCVHVRKLGRERAVPQRYV